MRGSPVDNSATILLLAVVYAECKGDLAYYNFFPLTRVDATHRNSYLWLAYSKHIQEIDNVGKKLLPVSDKTIDTGVGYWFVYRHNT